MTLYAILGIIAAALAAVFGFQRKASKAETRAAAARDALNAEKLKAAESRHANERAADKVELANEAVGEIDAARVEAERRVRVLEEAMLNEPKIDPADPRPGAARLRAVPSGEIVPGVRRDPGEDR